VVEGKKTATTWGFVFYELEKEPIPQAGEYYYTKVIPKFLYLIQTLPSLRIFYM